MPRYKDPKTGSVDWLGLVRSNIGSPSMLHTVVLIGCNLGADILQQYGNHGLNGQPLPLSYTEEVVGSSPIPTTQEPLGVEVFTFIKPNDGG
jgi:hypothetical protein